MSMRLRAALDPVAPATSILIRVAVGGVFLSEGIQKFLYPAQLGAGRFVKLGIPWPELTGPFVGAVELTCGAMLLLGLCTRLAAIPLAIDMLVAIFTTKIPILLGHEFWGFALRELPRHGFWAMAHEARTDFAMLLGALYLLATGPDRSSVDAWLHRRTTASAT